MKIEKILEHHECLSTFGVPPGPGRDSLCFVDVKKSLAQHLMESHYFFRALESGSRCPWQPPHLPRHIPRPAGTRDRLGRRKSGLSPGAALKCNSSAKETVGCLVLRQVIIMRNWVFRGDQGAVWQRLPALNHLPKGLPMTWQQRAEGRVTNPTWLEQEGQGLGILGRGGLGEQQLVFSARAHQL